MAKKQIEVLCIESFRGAKFVFRTDKPYEQELLNVFTGLIEQCPLGSIATVSKRMMDEDKYENITKARIKNGMIVTGLETT